jgi:flagellar basal body P-ring formation protein FlgA
VVTDSRRLARDRILTLKNVTRRLLSTTAITALVAISGAARAQALQDVDAIRATAENFIRTQLQTQSSNAKLFVEAASLDPRLRLPQCASLVAFLPSGPGVGTRTTVGVRCLAPLWSVYVPVSVESQLGVLVLRQAVQHGASVGPNDVEVQTRRVQGFAANYVLDVTALAGKHLKNDAPQGTPLTSALLVPDIIIKRGQRVTLIASVGGIEVRAQGEAISDATAAGRVRVQNLASQKVVEGEVESADVVRVGM